jgi:hypothetical protein
MVWSLFLRSQNMLISCKPYLSNGFEIYKGLLREARDICDYRVNLKTMTQTPAVAIT